MLWKEIDNKVLIADHQDARSQNNISDPKCVGSLNSSGSLLEPAFKGLSLAAQGITEQIYPEGGVVMRKTKH